jgi:GPH family glycoside/pentoside/hexuronide:cation symporter
MVKFGFAVAGGLSGLIMGLVGFVPDAATQPPGAMTGMRLAYSLLPITGALLAIWVMRDYDLTETRANEIRAELERRRGKSLFG